MAKRQAIRETWKNTGREMLIWLLAGRTPLRLRGLRSRCGRGAGQQNRLACALVILLVLALLIAVTLPAWCAVDYPGAVDILGAEEVVYDWTTDRCEDENIPDAAVRAFRDSDGKIQLIIAHWNSYRMIGNDFNSLATDCANGPVLTSDFDGDPASYNTGEWLHSLYTLDGTTIYAFLHNEYHGQDYPGYVTCPSGDGNLCWYNSVTLAISTNKGSSYAHAAPPDHLVASIPYEYEPDVGPSGVFNGSNILFNQSDGYYYKLVQLEERELQEVGVCPIRTQNLADPSSWRAWDGTGYNVQFVNPYTESGFDPADHVCQPLDYSRIEKMRGSISYNTYFDKFLLVGSAQLSGVWGFYYSLSDDLVNWTNRRLIMPGNLQVNPAHSSNADVLAYPSLIDHNDTSRNFEVTGREAYLYYTRWHAPLIYGTWDRDVVRIPIRFNKLAVDGFTVDTVSDTTDSYPGDGICDTGGGECSLRAAIAESNARPHYFQSSVFPIGFDIPGTGPFTIQYSISLDVVSAPVAIDGYTQAGASPNTNDLDQGNNAVLQIVLDGTLLSGETGLEIKGGNTTVRGLAISNFGVGISLTENGGNTIEGNFIGTNASGTSAAGNGTVGISGISGNTIGGSTNADRNIIAKSVTIDGVGATSNVVQGNYIGVDATGAVNIGDGTAIIQNGAQNNTVISNVLSAGNRGVEITGGGTSGNQVLSNFLGTDVTGTIPIGNGFAVVLLADGAQGNTIGLPGQGNVIGDGETGVRITDSGTTGNTVQNNFIGTDSGGSIDLGNSGHGVTIVSGAGNNTIQNNTIANNTVGVVLQSGAGTGNAILGNAIYSNGFGIDLNLDGVTPNDGGDSDTGPNNLQNFPLLSSAVAGSVTIQGTLNSTPSITFRLEFFETTTCDGTGYGQGESYLGFVQATTDGSGNVGFSETLAGSVTAGSFVTATATDPSNNTSEFCGCTEVIDPSSFTADLSISKSDDADPVAEGNNLAYTVSVTNSGPDNDSSTVTVTDTLPSGVSFVSASGTGWSCVENSGVVTCTRAGLNVEAAPAITITVTVNTGTSGTITNNVSVSSPTTDTTPANDSASEETTVIPLASTADLAITKTDNPDPILTGMNVFYTLTVTNNGPSAATDVTVVDNLPPTGSVIKNVIPSQGTYSSVGDIITCNLGSLASGATATVTIVIKRNAAGTVTNNTTVSANELDSNATDNSVSEETTFSASCPTGTVTVTSPSNTGVGVFSFDGNIQKPQFPLGGGGSPQTWENVSVGTYFITEQDPAGVGVGYVVTDISCVEDVSSNSIADVYGRTAAINVEAGETVTVTFTNTEASQATGTIIVQKQTNPGGAAGTFGFTTDIGEPATFTLDDAQSQTYTDVPMGQYTVTEDDPSGLGFDLTSIACDDGDSSGDLGTRTATIKLAVGETVTCTFTNTLDTSAAVFRVDPSGDVFGDGTFHAAEFVTGSADVAEWVAVSEPVEAGDVLELDPAAFATYRRSLGPCSELVGGVVSTRPGFTLAWSGAPIEKALLALVGIVPVKVTNEGGPIQPGDLLVSSSTPGHAMRWAGPGPCAYSLVGKALEPMSDEQGIILALLTAH